jgi:LacI family transcriptional regulator
LSYFGPSSVLSGIEQKSNELGFSLLLSLLDDFDPALIDGILRNLLSRQVDGIIWAVPGNDKLVGELSGRFSDISVPVVYMNKLKNGDEVIVAMDNRLGGRLATDHLLEQGFRRIGIITGPIGWWEAQEREKGWRETMGKAGLTNLEELIINGDWTAASGEIGLHNLIAKSPDIDAVFACNDQMALGALQAARRLGIKVPQDLGIVGFDDIPEAAYFYPSLTTIHQNANALGALAVDRMCSFINARVKDEEFEPEVKWIQPRLIVRKSSKRA